MYLFYPILGEFDLYYISEWKAVLGIFFSFHSFQRFSFTQSMIELDIFDFIEKDFIYYHLFHSI